MYVKFGNCYTYEVGSTLSVMWVNCIFSVSLLLFPLFGLTIHYKSSLRFFFSCGFIHYTFMPNLFYIHFDMNKSRSGTVCYVPCCFSQIWKQMVSFVVWRCFCSVSIVMCFRCVFLLFCLLHLFLLLFFGCLFFFPLLPMHFCSSSFLYLALSLYR